ncbi:MAG: putative LPS assembly protein LptD, partial [Chitinophagaceae bacterium]
MYIFGLPFMRINHRKVSRFYQYRLPGILSVLIFLTLQLSSFKSINSHFHPIFKPLLDTIPKNKNQDTVSEIPFSRVAAFKDTTKINKTDTIKIPISADSITAPVQYKADDSMVLDVRTRRMYLYGKGDVSYADIKLTAPSITFDQSSQIVTAKMGRDSAGNVSGMAKLVQAETTTVSDSIKFNFKTQKGLTHNSYFQQEEIYNFAEKVKKMDAQTFFAYKGRFTTCNLDTPHFAFRFRKAKFINKKVAVTGSVHPEFEDVPIPIYLPFGIFPLERGRHSGILPPQLNFNQDYGLGLEGLGYYKVFNEFLDAKLWSDIYSYGSWRLNLAPSYRVRYRFSGGFTISVQDTKIAFKGDPDYSQSRSFFITWNHSMDGKARPGVSFSANVQAGSSKYLKLLPNGGLMNAGNIMGQGQNRGGYTQPLNFTNQLSSSISFQKSWIGKPYALSLNLNHNQNTQTGIVNVSLPDMGFIVNTIYPFQPKEFVGESKWYEKLGVGYNGTFRNQVSFYDSAFRFNQIIDKFQWGANHEIPITLSLPQLGPLQLAPSISYRERWFGQQMYRTWNKDTKKLDTSIQKGLYSAREMSFAFSLGTAFFGTFNAKGKNARIQAIRHVMRPTAGFSYKPDMNSQYYYRAQIDTNGNKYLFSVYDGSLYQAYSPGRTGGLNFEIDN